MSGGSLRSAEMKRSISRSILPGFTSVMPSAKQTAELAAEPRPWQRIFSAARKAHDVGHGEEVGLVLELGDQRQFALDLRVDGIRHAVRPAPAHAVLGELAQPRAGVWPSGTSSFG